MRKSRVFLFILALAIAAGTLIVFLRIRKAPVARNLELWSKHESQCSLVEISKGFWMHNWRMGVYSDIEKHSRCLRREDGLELWETPKGNWWVVQAPDPSGLFALIGEQEENIYGQNSHGVSKGDIVLDCGASYGTFTKKALSAGASKVIAIDPAPDVIECLRRNLSAEIESGKVIVYPKGVWNRLGSMPFHVAPDGRTWGDTLVLRDGKEATISVELTTIDAIVEELKLPRVDFIKLDIEGAEKQAMAGAAQTVQRYHPRFAVASYHLPDDVDEIPKILFGISKYRSSRWGCKEMPHGLAPEVMYFY